MEHKSVIYKVLKKKSALLSVIIIALSILVAIFGYCIAPDSTPDANEQSPLHPAHECVQQKGREPRALRCTLHDELQFLPHPQNHLRHASDGGGRYGSRLDDGRSR